MGASLNVSSSSFGVSAWLSGVQEYMSGVVARAPGEFESVPWIQEIAFVLVLLLVATTFTGALHIYGYAGLASASSCTGISGR